jgi:hypothetical protein
VSNAICAECGATFEQNTGPSRPRRFCLECSPRDPLATTRGWRRRNGEAYNTRRRQKDAERQAEAQREGSRSMREHTQAAGSAAMIERIRKRRV